MRHQLLWLLAALAALLLVISCQEEGEDTNDPGNGEPTGQARIEGDVRDPDGNPLSGVALHRVYVLPGRSPLANPQVPSTAFFYNTDQVLFTECGGTTPIPDGVMVRLFWDQDSDGADDTDPRLPLCAAPPECDTGPPQTVGRNEFAINGVESGIGAGLFYSDNGIATVSDMLAPNRYYGRIYCGDGNALYVSEPIDVAAGYGEYEMNFFPCTPCSGEPEVPAWRLEQPYPNPAVDSVTVRYALQATAPVLLTLHWPGHSLADTLFYANSMTAGGHRVARSLDDLQNGVANGLYRVRLSAGSFTSEKSLLRNVEDEERLRTMQAATTSDTDGSFGFDAPAGTEIQMRGSDGTSEGTALLSRLRVVATRSGYQVRDTTFDIVADQIYTLDLRLVPE